MLPLTKYRIERSSGGGLVRVAQSAEEIEQERLAKWDRVRARRPIATEQKPVLGFDIHDFDYHDDEPAPRRRRLKLRNREEELNLAPLTSGQRQDLFDALKGYPKARDSLPIERGYAGELSIRGPDSKPQGSVIAARIVIEMLARTGNETAVSAHGYVFAGSVRLLAQALDGGRQGYYAEHFGEIIQALEQIDQVRLVLVRRDKETGECRILRVPIVAAIETPVTVTADNRVRIALNPGLVRLLQFGKGKKAARTTLSLDTLYKVRSLRAINMFLLLARQQGLFWQFKRDTIQLDLQQVRAHFNLPAQRYEYTTRRASRKTAVPTAYEKWSEVWKKLQAAARDLKKNTRWDFDMAPVREGRRVVAVRWRIKRVDRDFRSLSAKLAHSEGVAQKLQDKARQRRRISKRDRHPQPMNPYVPADEPVRSGR